MQSLIDRIIQNGAQSRSLPHGYSNDFESDDDEHSISNPSPDNVNPLINPEKSEYSPLQPLLAGLDGATDSQGRPANSRTPTDHDTREATQKKAEWLRAKLLAGKRLAEATSRESSAMQIDGNASASIDLDRLVEEGRAAAAVSSKYASTPQNLTEAVQTLNKTENQRNNSKELYTYEKIQDISNTLQTKSRPSSVVHSNSSGNAPGYFNGTAGILHSPDVHPETKTTTKERALSGGNTPSMISQLAMRPSQQENAPDSPQKAAESRRQGERLGTSINDNFETMLRDETFDDMRVSSMQIEPNSLDEWLEATGYHDEAYRKRALQRHRALKKLKEQQAELEKEALLESQIGTYVYRAPSRQPVPKEELTPSKSAMAPPSTLTRTPGLEPTGTKPMEYYKRQSQSSGTDGTVTVSRLTENNHNIRLGHKGSAVDAEPARNTEPSRYSQVATFKRDGRSASPRSLKRRASLSNDRDRREAPPRFNTTSDSSRDYRQRATGHYAAHRSGTEDQLGGLTSAGARYFIIKSWNYDNVDEAKYENIWATQAENEDMLVEAFKTCRDVFLIFSVNKSRAFQGFARMETLPGTAPTPRWVERLNWPTSPPFRIRWISKAETHFKVVGHLNNSMNENLSVIVGRDGQEIEPKAGAELIKLLD